MSQKSLGYVLLVVGLLIAVFVLIASPLHIMGSSFGTKHLIGLVVGVVILVVGIFLSFIKKT